MLPDPLSPYQFLHISFILSPRAPLYPDILLGHSVTSSVVNLGAHAQKGYGACLCASSLTSVYDIYRRFYAENEVRI